MKLHLYPLVILASLLAPASFGQEKPGHIGEIEFYGRSSLDQSKIREALPVREGDEFNATGETIFNLIERVTETLKRVTGSGPTDVSPICCDSQGNWIIYIGLPGASLRSFQYNPVPRGSVRLPPEALTLYRETMAAWMPAVQKQAAEDVSQGFALSSDPALRARQLAVRDYALRNESLLRSVLESSADAQHRIAAAYLLGYTRQSNAQIAALVRASRDSDDTVRNNASRALGVLATANSKLAERIPAAGFIEMLSSGSWTDRNKAGYVLDALTKWRNPRLLGQLRSNALDTLLEMARWRVNGHAYSARMLLGRIAGIEESRLKRLAENGEAEQIIDALKKKS